MMALKHPEIQEEIANSQWEEMAQSHYGNAFSFSNPY